MSLLHKLAQNPTLLALVARDAFHAVAVVQLERWRDLVAATSWCELRWRNDGRHYRRRIYAADQTATFEFANMMDALALRLASGRRFRQARSGVR